MGGRKRRKGAQKNPTLRTRFFAPALRESWVGVKAAMFARDPVSQQENCSRTYDK